MADEDTVAFTIRIPWSLRDQIDARANTMLRKRNAEIQHLLETGIDSSIASDLEVIRRMQAGRSEDED